MSGGEILELKTLRQKFDHLTEIAARQNETILRQNAALIRVTRTANDLGNMLETLVAKHEAGDREAVGLLSARIMRRIGQIKGAAA